MAAMTAHLKTKELAASMRPFGLHEVLLARPLRQASRETVRACVSFSRRSRLSLRDSQGSSRKAVCFHAFRASEFPLFHDQH